ncbi:MAG: site-2 protease family protein [Alphaproteobacteria bacterium]|jgi:Zn-dependent protease|nr:site-2 protease family protein [Alphaproteobacteria bacterium]
MNFDINAFLQFLSVGAIPLLLAITLHEAGHALAALKQGDKTAFMLGRVTLNPIKHIDPIGTVALPLILLVTGSPFLFGYARPVPVNFRNLRDSTWGPIIVAIAGPLANLILIFATIALMYVVKFVPAGAAQTWLTHSCLISLQINALLMVFNLLPILPLDGGRILSAVLKGPVGYWYASTERYGMFVLIGLMLVSFEGTSLLWQIMGPLMREVFEVISLLAPRIVLG